MTKLNSSSETSDRQTVTPVPVNVGGSDVGSEPAIMEDVMVERAKPDPDVMVVTTPTMPAVTFTRPLRVRSEPIWMRDYVKK